MKVIGITGGIASGKSLISKELIKQGYYVIDTDKIAHQLLLENNVIKEIINVFGNEVYFNGAINRKLLGRIIFKSKEKQQKLNAIIHPRVIDRVRELLTETKELIVFVDVPLLYESGMNEMMDKVLVVFVNQTTQLTRLIKRDQIDREYAMEKINMQMPLSEKTKLADYIIDNSYTVKDTLNQLEDIIRRIKNEI